MVQNVKFVKELQLSEHFKLSEFACPISNTVKYSPELIAMLELFFKNCSAIKKIYITSGYRTPDYSVKVGGSKTDAHTYGIACDAVFYDNKGNLIPSKYIACYAAELGFGGIGVMSTAIHLDVRHLGGYLNSKWWGDETTGYSLSKNGVTFNSYYGLDKNTVHNRLGISEVKTETKESEEMRYYKLKDVPSNYRTAIDKVLKVGALNGKGGSGEDTIIDLGEDTLRKFVADERMGVYDYCRTVGDVPQEFRPAVDELVAKGKLKGYSGSGDNRVIKMHLETLRALIINERK